MDFLRPSGDDELDDLRLYSFVGRLAFFAVRLRSLVVVRSAKGEEPLYTCFEETAWHSGSLSQAFSSK
jgi:hypothetical protein